MIKTYEYKCLKCGKLYYSSIEYRYFSDDMAICDSCGGLVFYSKVNVTKDNLEGLIADFKRLEEILITIKKSL